MSQILHTAFYQFVAVADTQALAAQLKESASDLLGLVIVAAEGINGTLAGSEASVSRFEQALNLDPRFASMRFKRSSALTQPFGKLKIHCKDQIVALGVSADAVNKPGVQLSAQQWRALLQRDDVVLIDNRNAFEYRLGHFKGAINPDVNLFSDFPNYLRAKLPLWQAQGKQVAMYCTGGIRCEKTSAWLEQLGIPSLQLEGGILQYFADLPDAEQDFIGDCFVFDNRLAINSKLEQTPVSLEQIYDREPDGAWRIARAKRLLDAVQGPDEQD